MKTVYELSKELQAGMVELYKLSGFDSLCRELSERICRMKDEVLVAWFAEHGFAPGKAVIVEDHSEGLVRYYIRESTAEEAQRTLASANRQITPYIERLKQCERNSCCNCGNVSCPLSGVNCSKFVPRTSAY